MQESEEMINLFFKDKEGSVPNFLTTFGADGLIKSIAPDKADVKTVSQATESAQALYPFKPTPVQMSKIKASEIKARNDQKPKSAAVKTMAEKAQVLTPAKPSEGWYGVAGVPAPSQQR
jgi:hypothetical protein